MRKKLFVILVILILIFIGIIFIPLIFNKENRGVTQQIPRSATISLISIEKEGFNTASLADVDPNKLPYTIRWQTVDYPFNVGLNINLIRKISSSPNSYEHLKSIAIETANDGIELWMPDEEILGDLYIEVVCSSLYNFKNGCSIMSEPIKVN